MALHALAALKGQWISISERDTPLFHLLISAQGDDREVRELPVVIAVWSDLSRTDQSICQSLFCSCKALAGSPLSV